MPEKADQNPRSETPKQNANEGEEERPEKLDKEHGEEIPSPEPHGKEPPSGP
jgi:hypothetical protein